MPTYTVREGQHPFKPSVSLSIGFGRERIGWKAVLTESCIYDLEGADQADWNKLAGLSFHLFDNHRNSAMFGWRWNPTLKVFDLNTYCHISGERFMGGPKLAVPPGVVFFVWIEIDYTAKYIRFNYKLGDSSYLEFVNFRELPKANREIGCWFGGNNPAPHRMEVWKERVWAWHEEGGYMLPDEEKL